MRDFGHDGLEYEYRQLYSAFQGKTVKFGIFQLNPVSHRSLRNRVLHDVCLARLDRPVCA